MGKFFLTTFVVTGVLVLLAWGAIAFIVYKVLEHFKIV